MVTLAEGLVTLRLSPAAAAELKAQTAGALTAAGAAAGPKAGQAAGATFSSNFGKSLRSKSLKETESWGAQLGTQVGGIVKKIGTMGAVGLAAVAVGSVKMAADFQKGLTTLVTGAGETERNLGKISTGIKSISVSTGKSTTDLIAGMYMIESAGFHGADGLKILTAAAQAAQISQADLGTVANAVTTVLTDYKLPAAQATNATNALVATVARGKTHMQDLATSMARVLPTAAALKIPIGDVGGAMATMTAEGTSARLAAMGLNATILAMAAPSATAAKTVSALGGSSKKVADTLTHHGLIAALQMVSDLALKAGPKGSAAYVGAMKDMLGGTQGLRVGLQLTGDHMKTLQANTLAVTDAMGKGGKSVTGWALAQKDASVQWDKFKATMQVVFITIGQKIIPVLQKIVGYLVQHKLIIPIVVVALGLMTTALLVMAAAWLATPLGMITLGIVAIGVAIALLAKNWKRIWNDIKVVAQYAWDYIKLAALTAIDWILKGFSHIPFIGHYFADAEKTVHGWIGNIQKDIDRLNGRNLVVGVHFATGTMKMSLAQWQAGGKLAAGGQVRGAGGPTDDMAGLFALSDKEWVIRAQSATAYGAAAMQAVNEGRAVIGYAAGGPVSLFSGVRVNTGPADSVIASQMGAQVQGMVNAHAAAWFAAFLRAMGPPPSAGAPPAGTAGGSIAALMHAMVSARGWGAMWPAQYALEMAEAGFNMYARNPKSGAYGLAQGITGPSWYYGYGGNPNTAGGQITAMLNYEAQRYGNPANAWAHEQQFHWYGQGGPINEAILGVGLRTGTGYGFHAGERVVPRPGRAGAGATVHIEQLVVRDVTDIDLIAQRLSYLTMSASLG
jgi:TP901 family phage tail tape measure protein